MVRSLVKSGAIIIGSLIIAVSLFGWDSFFLSSDQAGDVNAFTGQLASQAYVGMRGSDVIKYEHINNQLEKESFSGSILNVVDGQVSNQRGFGYANYALGLFNDWDTPMDVGNLNNLFSFLVLSNIVNHSQKLDWNTNVPYKFGSMFQNETIKLSDVIRYDKFVRLINIKNQKNKLRKLICEQLKVTKKQSKQLTDFQLETASIGVIIQLLTGKKFQNNAETFLNNHALTHTYFHNQTVVRGETLAYQGDKKGHSSYQKQVTNNLTPLTIRANSTDIYAWLSLLFEKNIVSMTMFNSYIKHTLPRMGTAQVTGSHLILNIRSTGFYSYIVYDGQYGNGFILRSNYNSLRKAIITSKMMTKMVFE